MWRCLSINQETVLLLTCTHLKSGMAMFLKVRGLFNPNLKVRNLFEGILRRTGRLGKKGNFHANLGAAHLGSRTETSEGVTGRRRMV